ncbi:cysteine hydrolase family protein [Paenibacillus sp. D2_2]|uniref:cysteine hydrolase family protein n=1 Tax=Paenibacillus sp. D2_2 TaxID=3073092 RepID=UPI002814B920|nr:cysteine hydrolase family protein [Paenibacillus sp. D2_2]WMT39359.1 cysteine hydrolase family protein [Paenibacillus sp. D2_2]
MARALVVIDLQKGLHTEEEPLFGLNEVLEGVNERIAVYREDELPVIFVQHHDEGLPLHSPEWDLMDELDVRETDHFVSKTHANSFYQTNLTELLTSLNADKIEFCGAQTEYCVDTTVRMAHGLGYRSFMKKGLHTTTDSVLLSADVIRRHHEALWGNRFLTWI